jgi:hypothetical protein
VAVTEARVVRIESQVEEHGKMLGSLRDDIVRLEERMDRRFDAVDRRFDGIDQRLSGIDRRFDGIDQRLGSLEEKMDRRFDAIDAKMSRQFMWLAGMMVTTLAAMLASVLAR